jgi:putative ABC transport system substrate-binding protein
VDRRRFQLTSLAGVLTAPLAAGAQQPRKVFRIGVFHLGDHAPPGLSMLRAGLAALGYEEGKSILVYFRNLADEEAARETARAFVRDRVDVIVAFGNPTIRAARAATSETPIVMVHSTDPVAERFVNTLARPGGNVTGFVFFSVSPGKHLEFLREIVPRLRRALVVSDPQDAVSAQQLAELRSAAESMKPLQLVEREARGAADLERLFGSIKQGDVDAALSASVNLHIRFTSLLIRLCSERRLPLVGYRKDSVQQGALLSYAPDDAAAGRRAAEYVDRILRGAKPADLPVEQPTEFELVINLKTAKALGLTIPPSLLARADQVIE